MESLLPVLVEVTRGAMVESRHRGAAVVTDAAGRIVMAWGDGMKPIYARSALKPLQALPLVESGAADAFGLGPRELALACGSHHGEAAHVAAVASWLARIGLGLARSRMRRSSADRSRRSRRRLSAAARRRRAAQQLLRQACRAFSRPRAICGEPTRGYIAAEHPVQRRVLANARGDDRARSRRARRAASMAAAFR